MRTGIKLSSPIVTGYLPLGERVCGRLRLLLGGRRLGNARSSGPPRLCRLATGADSIGLSVR